MLVPETIELHTSLLKNKFEGSYLEGFETLISNLKSQLKAQYKTLLKEKKSAALKESWHRLIAAVKTKNTSLFWHIIRGLGKSPLPPTNQEEFFRELYIDPDYVTKESQISLDQTPYWS
ncbi:hypothetical protein E2320_002167, partial [Naja naja]